MSIFIDIVHSFYYKHTSIIIFKLIISIAITNH